MAFFTEDPFASPSRRHTLAEDPPSNHFSRSWTSNGINFHIQGSSHASPGFGFGMMGGNVRNQTQPTPTSSQDQPRSRGPSLLGSFLNALGSAAAARQTQTSSRRERRQERRSSVDDLAYGDDYSDGQQSTLYSSFPRRASPELVRERRGSARGQSPRRRGPHGGEARRSRSYRTDKDDNSRTNRRSAYVEESTDDHSGDSSAYSDEMGQQNARRAFVQDDDSTIEALQNAALHHRREAIRCRERAQQLLQLPIVDTQRMQQLLNDIRGHESAFEKIQGRLNLMQHNRHQSANRPRATFTFQTSQSHQVPRDDFESFFFQTPQQHRSHFMQQSMFDGFDAFPGMPFGTSNSFFSEPGTGSAFGGGFQQFSSTRGAPFSAGPQSQARSVPRGTTFAPQTGPSIFTPPRPVPPANLLKPEEAKRLFKTYNERWNSLGPADPNIPYPARKLHASSLLSRDSIWAPMVNSSITDWSEEVVMQANAQAFYLGVVGLSPQYTESPASGKICMGYIKLKATAAQVKELVDLLKKEKARWHSDRLGRRNAGVTGTNEALQKDEKARAVFHAVCELMEAAQGG